jgi:MoxR-like ATPase
MDFDAKYFDPLNTSRTVKLDNGEVFSCAGELLDNGDVSFRAGKLPEDVYVYKAKTILAVNVALATRRPLLVSGEPGSGKSTLAKSVARVLDYWYYKQMITSRTQGSDLLWNFDALRRLSDANTPGKPLFEEHYYIDPGTLWWAFDPNSAEDRGIVDCPLEPKYRAVNPGTPPAAKDSRNAIVLIDEIDKADPDVPNDLLEPFDLRAFTVRETNHRVEAQRDLLLILTTNGERELPPAVLRRCVALTLDPPTEDWFQGIADRKFGASEDGLHADVAKEVMRLRQAAKRAGRRESSTAEYLDALKVCRDLKVNTKSKAWSDVARTVLWKHEQAPPAGPLKEEEEIGEEP